MTTLVTTNENYARSAAVHNADLAYIAAQGAQVIFGQEIAPKAKVATYAQVGTKDERLFIRHDVQIVRSGVKLAALSRLGNKIGLRTFPWAIIEDPAFGEILCVCVHMPPRRMTGALRAMYAYRLRRLIRRRAVRHGYGWVAGGDWNVRVNLDPADLAAKFGAVWFGPRIDGFAVSGGLAKHVKSWADRSRIRADDHPIVWLDLRS